MSLYGLTEQLSRQHLPGLVRACQELETAAPALFGNRSMPPLPVDQANGINASSASSRPSCAAMKHREPRATARRTSRTATTTHGIARTGILWEDGPDNEEQPLAILFVPDQEGRAYPPKEVAAIMAMRTRFPTSYFFCLANLQSIVLLQRAAADACVPAGKGIKDVLSRILDPVQREEEETHRVLLVDDSATAAP